MVVLTWKSKDENIRDWQGRWDSELYYLATTGRGDPLALPPFDKLRTSNERIETKSS